MSIGVSEASLRLMGAIRAGRAPHALFIASEDTALAAVLARRAAALHCTGSEDTSRLAACRDCLSPKEYKVEPVRELMLDLYKSSFSGGNRAVLLIDAHRLNSESQNAILKTLEEPPQGILFLLTGREALLLPTILSRCAIVRCPLPTVSETAKELEAMGASHIEAVRYAEQGGTLTRAERLYRDEDYRARRARAREILLRLMAGTPPFDAVKADADIETLHFMLSILGDAQRMKTGRPVTENKDAWRGLEPVFSGIGMGRIKRMTDAVSECMERLNTNAPAQSALTRMYTQITEEL